jgi:hypothetical protein
MAGHPYTNLRHKYLIPALRMLCEHFPIHWFPFRHLIPRTWKSVGLIVICTLQASQYNVEILYYPVAQCKLTRARLSYVVATSPITSCYAAAVAKTRSSNPLSACYRHCSIHNNRSPDHSAEICKYAQMLRAGSSNCWHSCWTKKGRSLRGGLSMTAEANLVYKTLDIINKIRAQPLIP